MAQCDLHIQLLDILTFQDIMFVRMAYYSYEFITQLYVQTLFGFSVSQIFFFLVFDFFGFGKISLRCTELHSGLKSSSFGLVLGILLCFEQCF